MNLSVVVIITNIGYMHYLPHVKPGSHRQDMAQDTARTCHDQEFRSENSFNS